MMRSTLTMSMAVVAMLVASTNSAEATLIVHDSFATGGSGLHGGRRPDRPRPPDRRHERQLA